MSVYVTFIELNDVYVSRSGGIISQNTIKTDDFKSVVSSSGDIQIEPDARTIDNYISRSGNIELNQADCLSVAQERFEELIDHCVWSSNTSVMIDR